MFILEFEQLFVEINGLVVQSLVELQDNCWVLYRVNQIYSYLALNFQS